MELLCRRWPERGWEGPRESRLRECLRLRPSKVEVLLERFGEYEGAGTSVSERTREGERDIKRGRRRRRRHVYVVTQEKGEGAT